jgi:ferric-dicitrate binding protein FerR (iron transport regulator)
MMPNNRLWLLIARQLTGEASSDEKDELRDLVEEHPEKQYLLDLLHSYFSAHSGGMDFTDTDVEERFRKMMGHPEPGLFHPIGTNNTDNANSTDGWEQAGGKPKWFLLRKIAPWAAAFIGMVIIGWGIVRLTPSVSKPVDNKRTLAGINEVIAKPGVRTKLVLPDGTQIWLNSGSKLNYQDDFNHRSREVELEGEAFFDVVKNPRLPFIVHASSINVKVLGTAFTVKSYPQDQTIETTLLRGIIEVTRQDNPSMPRVILKPNEKLIFAKLLPPAAIHTSPDVLSSNLAHPPAVTPGISITSIARNVPDSDKVETSWMYNKLVFNGDSFQELAEKMERWYNVRIRFKDKELFKYRFGGVFTHETVQDALDALRLTAPFTYKINYNEIELSKN